MVKVEIEPTVDYTITIRGLTDYQPDWLARILEEASGDDEWSEEALELFDSVAAQIRYAQRAGF